MRNQSHAVAARSRVRARAYDVGLGSCGTATRDVATQNARAAMCGERAAAAFVDAARSRSRRTGNGRARRNFYHLFERVRACGRGALGAAWRTRCARWRGRR
jgi:hypothetical protein